VAVVKAKEVITANQKMLDILKQAKGIAPSRATMRIRGESGTGKELLATFIHQHSQHPQAPYVALITFWKNSAAPSNLAQQNARIQGRGSR
jgi:transcriptional regulator with PAS, ATPase and Fis domain